MSTELKIKIENKIDQAIHLDKLRVVLNVGSLAEESIHCVVIVSS